MNTYVALLRGINVGGNNKIEMAKLKKTFESLGHSDVVTYINSGNVIFKTRKKSPDKLTTEIEQAILKDFDLHIPVVLRSKENIEKICTKISKDWHNNKEQKTDVLFLWKEFDSKTTLELVKKNPRVDTLLYIDGAIIWHLEKKNYTKSGMHDIISTKLYKNMTVRNINTVRKLTDLMKQSR